MAAPFARCSEWFVDHPGGELVQPDEQIELGVESRKGGPGHYIVDGGIFSTAGTWEVQIAARVSEFDEYQKTIEVPIP